jgi:hypothetical protein
MGEFRNEYNISFIKLKAGDRLVGLSVNGRIILKLILGKYGGKVWTEFIWLRIGTSGELL